MAEQQNVALVTKLYEAFGRGDTAFIIDQLTDDVRWVSHFEPIVPWGGDFSGKTQVPRFFQAIGESVDVTAFNPGEFVAQGETVVSMGEFGCKVRATGKSALTPWVSSGSSATAASATTSSFTTRPSPTHSGRNHGSRFPYRASTRSRCAPFSAARSSAGRSIRAIRMLDGRNIPCAQTMSRSGGFV